jgi:hypothetical protein
VESETDIEPTDIIETAFNDNESYGQHSFATQIRSNLMGESEFVRRHDEPTDEWVRDDLRQD